MNRINLNYIEIYKKILNEKGVFTLKHNFPYLPSAKKKKKKKNAVRVDIIKILVNING